MKRSRFERANIILTMFIWVAFNENAKRAKIWWTITEICLNPGFLQEQKKSYLLDADISSWSYDMEGHAKKCVERYCELPNKTTQQPYRVTTPCLNDHQFKEEELGSGGEMSQEMISNSSEMLVSDTHWQTRHSIFSKQTCTSSNHMDQLLSQTLGSFDFLYSSHK